MRYLTDYRFGKCILVTGAAGFIGFHLIKRLLEDDWFVIGTDNLNDYYDPALKYARLAELSIPKEEVRYNKRVVGRVYEKFSFIQLNLEDKEGFSQLIGENDIRVICHLGAQTGVRYSIENPMAYVESNLLGFTNLMEQARKRNIEHVVFASSSSVYGLNATMPFSTHNPVDHPLSFYAATKRSNELMAHAFSHLYGIPTTGLRFFTVYGPWGRPDMSTMLFADAIMNNKPVKVFNNGEMTRDFTYVDDVVDVLEKVLRKPPVGVPPTKKTKTAAKAVPLVAKAAPPVAKVASQAAEVPPPVAETDEFNGYQLRQGLPVPADLDPSCSTAPFRLYNVGGGSPVKLIDFLETLEAALGKKAIKEMLPMQAGDVLNTFCDVADLERDFGYKPGTSIKVGLQAFADWYKEWYTGDHPRIKEERIIVGKYPFPAVMHWKYIWNKHLVTGFKFSDNPDELLKSMVLSDGFDLGLNFIETDAWKGYVHQVVEMAELKAPMSVFEVGCGGGAFLYPLHRQGFKVAGVDYASPLIHLSKLAMPGRPFEVEHALNFDTAEKTDVVLANSVFQYFDSLDVAEKVLLKMLEKSSGQVLVLNVPDLATEAVEIEASRAALQDGMYESLYSKLSHLYFTREWFRLQAEKQGFSLKITDQYINGYGKNRFRFNCFITKQV